MAVYLVEHRLTDQVFTQNGLQHGHEVLLVYQLLDRVLGYDPFLVVDLSAYVFYLRVQPEVRDAERCLRAIRAAREENFAQLEFNEIDLFRGDAFSLETGVVAHRRFILRAPDDGMLAHDYIAASLELPELPLDKAVVVWVE